MSSAPPIITLEKLSGEAIEQFWQRNLPRNHHLLEIERVYERGTLPNARGEQIPIRPGALSLDGLKLLYALACTLQPKITVETGFGFGMSAWTFLAAHAAIGHKGLHIAIDPWYKKWTQKAGKLHLEGLGFSNFHLLEHPSWLGLPLLLNEGLLDGLLLALLDGSHLFEQVMVDFCLLDQALQGGGILLFDDAEAPAIETLLNYIETNRTDYAVSRTFSRVAILQKRGADRRRWDHFVPFQLSLRRDWPLEKG